MLREGRRTGEENKSTYPNDTATKKIEYLMVILEDNINLYSSNFRKEERPKIDAIMDYYGLVRDGDYETFLRTSYYGNKELVVRFYFDPDFNDGTWRRDKNGHLDEGATIYREYSFEY